MSFFGSIQVGAVRESRGKWFTLGYKIHVLSHLIIVDMWTRIKVQLCMCDNFEV